MKYLSIFPVLLLTSCQNVNPPIESDSKQTLTQRPQQEISMIEETEIALPDEINQALLADVSIDIIHPIEV